MERKEGVDLCSGVDKQAFLGCNSMYISFFVWVDYWLGIRVISHSAKSRNSSGEALCTKSGYDLNVTFFMPSSSLRKSTDLDPHWYWTTGSCVPCPQKTCNEETWGPWSSLILSFKVKKPDSDTTPAKGEGHMRPVRIEIAPPCENPPTTMRSEGMPAWICLFTKAWIVLTLSRSPFSSSGASGLRDKISNQDGILAPMFKLTGWIGASGKTQFTQGMREPSCWARKDQPAEVSPRPWLKMTAADFLTGVGIPGLSVVAEGGSRRRLKRLLKEGWNANRSQLIVLKSSPTVTNARTRAPSVSRLSRGWLLRSGMVVDGKKKSGGQLTAALQLTTF